MRCIEFIEMKTILILITFMLLLTPLLGNEKAVTIEKKDNYYSVTLDFSIESNHKKMGEYLAVKTLKMIPDYEKIVDSYLADIIPRKRHYKGALLRLAPFKKNMAQEYKDEIEGFASKMSGGNKNVRNDGKLSLDELYLVNLITDALRPTACSAVGVYGSKSLSGKSLIGRVLDWNGGDSNQFDKINSVITYKNDKKSIMIIGVIGHFGVITGINNDKLFVGILDSSTGAKYSNKDKRSYSFDIRYALENYSSLKEVTDYLSSDKNKYAFNHLLIIGDSKELVVLENNISGKGKNMKRAVRKSDSKLNKGVKWGVKNSIAVVNSFVLKGNHDNHTYSKHNKRRWKFYKSSLLKFGKKKLTIEDIKSIVTSKKGEIYNDRTRQIILFKPDTLSLNIFFKSDELDGIPVFKKIDLKF